MHARAMDNVTRIDTAPRRHPRTAACHVCGMERPLVQMLRAPEGPVCDRCAVVDDVTGRARKEAWGNLRTGLGLVAATGTSAIAAVLASGRIPFVGVDPTATLIAFGLAAGLAALSVIWGGWAAVTGGDRRLAPTGTFRTAVRISGASAAVMGLGTGLLVTTLAVLGLLPLLL